MSLPVARWPPELTAKPAIQGYLTDTNHRSYSRDIGRSFSLGGNLYYLFGDTFCKDDAGCFVGLVSNSYSLIRDPSRPLESSYWSIDETNLVEPLLNLTDEETQFAESNGGLRYVLWPFSGVVDIGDGTGLAWYEKGISHDGPGISPRFEHLGIGLAEISIDPSHPAKLHSRRLPGMLFDPDTPRYGSVSTLLEGDYIYLYGQIPGACQIAVARVHKEVAEVQSAYEHWDGSIWTSDAAVAPAPVFSDLPQGAIFRTSLFGPSTPFAFAGVSKWASSRIRIGLAPRLEGPWDIRDVGLAEGINHSKEYRYCFYPHPWALNGAGELMMTWSEHYPGGIVAANLEFKQDDVEEKNGL